MATMYFAMFRQMQKTLGQMNLWFDKATEHATALKFEPSVYLSLRLAPNQLSLVRQVQIACDTLKLGAARLTGKEAPSHADDEQTLDQLRARIESTLGWLATLTEKDYETVATRSITQPRWEGKVMTGHDYFLEHVTPNFFFHASHTYALLRHAGVPLGKRDYLGVLSQRLP